MEEAYILSAFRRQDEYQSSRSREEEAGEVHQNKETAADDLPPVESLRATLQTLRVQDRLARAPLVPEPVPTVPTMTVVTRSTASRGSSQGESSQGECDAENARGFRGEFANAQHVTSLSSLHADAQDS